jgi:hypothetical protein
MRNRSLKAPISSRSHRSSLSCAVQCPVRCSVYSDDVPVMAKRLGASDSEAAWLLAVFKLEGFGGLEYDRRYSASRVVASELRRLRALAN